MLDYRFDNAVVYNGDDPATGPATLRGSLGVRGERLVYPVDSTHPAEHVIDCGGAAIAPGFIDIHSHSDYAALYAPDAVSKLMTGFTTELNGNCGYGAFPLRGAMKDLRQEEYRGNGLNIDWQTTRAYLDRCRARPMALNQGLLIGHGTLRGSVVGLDARTSTADEVRTMQREVERAMQLGCFGVSTGLVYAPGSFADRAEVLALAEVVAGFGGLYASHLRSESDTLVEALDEFLGVCEQARCRAQYSHVKTSGRRNWHKLPDVRRRMDEARARGIEVYADRYPYTASSTDLMTILLPNDALSGGPDAVTARLEDPHQRATLKARIASRERLAEDGPGWFDRVMVCGTHAPALSAAIGKTLAAWARHMGSADPLEAAMDLLVADGCRTYGIHFSMSEENMREIFRWGDVMIGSDACLRDEVGEACAERPHPRAFGTPARVLGQLCRDAGWFDLPTAIHKLTGLCARVMRLKDRGRVADGYFADLVVFDPQTIRDRATYEHPTQPPSGVRWVFVNGRPAVTPEGPTRARVGKLLAAAF